MNIQLLTQQPELTLRNLQSICEKGNRQMEIKRYPNMGLRIKLFSGNSP